MRTTCRTRRRGSACPTGTPMSMPGWHDSQARRLAEGRRDRAVDRPDHAAASRGGPGRRGAPAPPCAVRSCAGDLRLLGAQRAEVVLEVRGAGRAPRPSTDCLRARVPRGGARGDEASLTGATSSRRAWMRRERLLALLERGEARVGGRRVGLRVADRGEDPVVLVGDAAQELAALEEVGEALGARGRPSRRRAARPCRARRSRVARPARATVSRARRRTSRARSARRSTWVASSRALASGRPGTALAAEAVMRRCRASIRAVVARDLRREDPLGALLRADLALLGLDLALQAVEPADGDAPSDGMGSSAHASRGIPAQSRRIAVRRTVTSGRT